MERYNYRFYRDRAGREGLKRFSARVKDSDLLILCDSDLEQKAVCVLGELRSGLEAYISRNEAFGCALRPFGAAPDAPQVVREMCRASVQYGVGPMASVAGVFSQIVGMELLKHSSTVIVENGGDIFARSIEPLTLALYAGEDSPFSNRVRFMVDASKGVGVCTSSATVGPSFSFGKADAVVAIAGDAGLADAAATAIANRVRSVSDIDIIMEEERERGLLKGLIACIGDRIGFFGDVELV